MDEMDRAIVESLVTDGRTTFSELASRIGLSGPSTAERVRRLESCGVIRGYAAILEPEHAGGDFAALVAVTLGSPAARPGFLSAIAEEPSVLEAHHVAGEHDYVLKVRCSGTRELERIVSERLKGIEGVAQTRTTVVLSTVFERPLRLLAP